MDRERILKDWVKRWCIPVLLTIVSVTVIFFVVNGVRLRGVPSMEDVERAEISYPSVTDEVKEVPGEKIELAVKLTGFLKYDPFKAADESGEPLITITYFTKDGREIAVSANRETVWWKGRAHALKEENLFVKLAEGIFFLEDLAEK